jgi:transposase
MPPQGKYPPELLDRGARLVFEFRWPIAHVARDLGVPSETLRVHMHRIEADNRLRPDLPTSQRCAEIYKLRRTNEILTATSVSFATVLGTDRPK